MIKLVLLGVALALTVVSPPVETDRLISGPHFQTSSFGIQSIGMFIETASGRMPISSKILSRTEVNNIVKNLNASLVAISSSEPIWGAELVQLRRKIVEKELKRWQCEAVNYDLYTLRYRGAIDDAILSIQSQRTELLYQQTLIMSTQQIRQLIAHYQIVEEMIAIRYEIYVCDDALQTDIVDFKEQIRLSVINWLQVLLKNDFNNATAKLDNLIIEHEVVRQASWISNRNARRVSPHFDPTPELTGVNTNVEQVDHAVVGEENVASKSWWRRVIDLIRNKRVLSSI